MKLYVTVLLLLMVPAAWAADRVVAKKGGAYKTIQAGIDAADPGDTILVKGGVYHERPSFAKSGEPDKWITLRAAPGEKVQLDGRGGFAKHMIDIDGLAFIRIEGLDLTQNVGMRDSACIHVGGAAHHICIVSNTMHLTRGERTPGILIENASSAPLAEVEVRGNTITDVQAEDIGAITLAGNVQSFTIEDNIVTDVTGAGIRIGRDKANAAATQGCSDGVCRANRITGAHASQGDGYVPGIIVDGADRVRIEQNRVTGCDRGLEIDAELAGRDTTVLDVKDNLLFGNHKSGLVIGGYKQTAGRVHDCLFTGNICYQNDTVQQGYGELWLQWGSANTIYSNVFFCGEGDALLMCPEPGSCDMNILNYNTWFSDRHDAGSAQFVWLGTELAGYKAYLAGSGQDARSRWADPGFSDPAATNFGRKGAAQGGAR